MRHVNRRRGKNSWWGDPDKILTEPHEQDYVKSYKNNGFKNASSKNTYVKFLRYIADNPGSTRKEILDGLGRLKGAADGGRGQNSSLFAQLLYLDLIDYDDKFKYFITDKGEEVLEKADKNDQSDGDIEGNADEGPDATMESTRKTTMKRLNITKEQFNKSQYFQKKYGKLEYVSESGKLFKTSKGKVLKFNEAGPHRVADDEDLDVPVTEMEEWLCDSIPDEIEFKFNELGELDLTCGANYHNPGEEQHIEIYVGIPEGDDPTDPKYDNIEEKLEKFVNEVCEREYKFKSSLRDWKGGEKWGDASFQWISDEQIFGELWPIDEQGQVNEVSGWKLEDEDLTLVNSESDGDKLYIVKLWWGAGYMLDCYNAYAFSDEEALNYVVAWIEKNEPKKLVGTDRAADEYRKELVKDGEAENESEAEYHPYFEETFMWVDATREGADEGHYVYLENLQIAQYPKEHDYPMSKGIKRESTKMDESMNWNGVTDKFIDNDNVQFTRKCPFCGKPHSITVPIHDVEYGCSAYSKGASIQDAFPNFSPDEREFFMSGICPDCWENM